MGFTYTIGNSCRGDLPVELLYLPCSVLLEKQQACLFQPVVLHYTVPRLFVGQVFPRQRRSRRYDNQPNWLDVSP